MDPAIAPSSSSSPSPPPPPPQSDASPSRSNWKNVNNWHWVEKNCFPWAEEYLRTVFQNFISSDPEVTIKVKRLDTITGDVNVNQRKGKLFYFFDLKISGFWKAETNDKSKKCSGSFQIDEFSNEIKSPQGLFFKLTLNEDTNDNAIFRSKFSAIMGEPFFNMLKRFRMDLEQSHGPSVLVDGPTTQCTQGSEDKAAVASVFKSWSFGEPSSASPGASAITGAISQKEYFMTDPKTLFEILTIPAKISVWTSSPPITPDPVVAIGQTYGLFDSNVVFRYTLLDHEQLLIEMNWRSAAWPSDHFSKVQLRLSEDTTGRRGTMVQMSQTGVPNSDVEAIKRNWNDYYWNSIKKYFGL